jgi:predicted outer membrane repeat protein
VQITGNSAIGQGGGIACYENCFPQLTNVTLSDNISQKVGGAIYSYASSQLSIVNSILWNDAPHEIYATGIDISYSDIMGGREGQGNIDQDPFFISSGERPYALSASSPCINAGNPDTAGLFLPPRDLWGNPRIWDGRIDMGAYEWSNVGFDNQPFNDSKPWWTVFPNPAKEEVVLSVNCGQSAVKSPVSLTICDIYGKEVIRLAFNQDRELKDQVRIDASGLPAGIYLIRVRAGSEDATRKIVKL